jgi:hypothetical protein
MVHSEYDNVLRVAFTRDIGKFKFKTGRNIMDRTPSSIFLFHDLARDFSAKLFSLSAIAFAMQC